MLTFSNVQKIRWAFYEEAGSAYEPEAFVNMVSDSNYDCNLPNSFSIDGARKSMNYLYRADGTKLKKNFLSTEYLDGFHYASSVGDEELWQMFQDAGGNAYEMEAFIAFTTETNFVDVLKFFPTAEGFYDFENNEYIYQ